jgi:hypothetical protein
MSNFGLDNEESFFANFEKRTYSYKMPLKIIFKLITDLRILTIERTPPIYKVTKDFYNQYSAIIELIDPFFKNLRKDELIYLFYAFIIQNSKTIEYFLNICDIMNKIIKHFFYFRKLDYRGYIQTRTYKNTYFQQYLIKRSKFEKIFNPEKPIFKNRKLDIDDSTYFSYFPMKCLYVEQKLEDCLYDDLCPFAHCDDEINYHPLIYKKIACIYKNIEDCEKKEKCHFYHENSEKMESEIDFTDDNIISLISKIQDIYEKTSNEQKYINEEIRNEYFIPSEFNPITYKTHKCPLNLLCKLPVNQCLNYHDNKNDRRRPFQTYNAEFCKNIFNLKTKKIIKGKTCPNNDDCKKCHNKFEIMYHPDQFRKHKCPLILKGKSCQNRLICPFTHDDEIEESFNETEIKNKTMIISNAKIVQNYYKKLMNDYYKAAKEYKNKLNDCYQLHKCPICHKHIMIKEKSYNICDNGLVCCDECAKEKKEEEFINVKIKLDE